MKKSMKTLVMVGLVLGMASQAAYAVDGAYSTQANRPMTVSAPNTWYTLNFPIPSGAIPVSNATLTEIYYDYSLGQSDVGSRGTLTVQLCQGSTINCTDVSSAKSGSTTFFKGKPAGNPLFLYYMVSSNRATGTITGNGVSQLSVNYTSSK